jgi:hypothetical protein
MATKFPPSNDVPAKDVTLDLNVNGNPQQLTYLAKRTLRKLDKEMEKIWEAGGEESDIWSDDINCAQIDVAALVEDKDQRKIAWEEIAHCNQLISIAANQLERAQKRKQSLLSRIDYYGEQSSYTIARQ